MSEITYKNLHVKERRFPTNGQYRVIGDTYFEGNLLQEKVTISDYTLLKSADRFIEDYARKEKLKLEREERHKDKTAAMK